MHPPIPSSTETSLGASYIREDLLQREARSNHVARSVRTIAGIVFVLLVVSIPWAIAVGPGAAIGWLVTYLIPVAAITGAIIASLALSLWASKRLPGSPLRDWYQ